MKYIEYAIHIGADEFVQKWVKTTLKNYLENIKEDVATETIEHILDYFVATGVKVSKMSFDEAKKNADKWMKAQIKKGSAIEEKPEDTEVVLDFKDGFKVVKLIGENAYKREGFLMNHCVASYFGRDVEIYSLRDKDNMPHCTMERDQQVKGKGNGDIHPKYVGYVVKFLEHIGMNVGDDEMKHLGYVNIEPILKDIDKKSVEKYLFNGKYFLKDKKDEIVDKKGNKKSDLDMLSVFDLIEEYGESIKVAFDIPLLVSSSLEWIRKKTKKKVKDENIQSGGNSSQLAGGDWSQLAGGYNSKLAGGYNSQLAGGYNSKLAGGYNSQLAGGYNSKLAGGDWSKLIVGERGIAVGDNGSKAKGGIWSVLVLVERNDNHDITHVETIIIDGKKRKADTWYSIKDGKLIEE